MQIHAEAKLFIQCRISILNFYPIVWLFGKAALLFQGKIKFHGAVSKFATSDFTQPTTAGRPNFGTGFQRAAKKKPFFPIEIIHSPHILFLRNTLGDKLFSLGTSLLHALIVHGNVVKWLERYVP